MDQFNERDTKTAKVDPEQCTPNNCINEVPTNASNNTVSPSNNVNEVPTTPTNNVVPIFNKKPQNNEEDRFAEMHPEAFNQLITKQTDPYPHYRVFRKGTKY